MSWAVGYDTSWGRDVGYGVPAECDHPDCQEEIDRGLGYICGDGPYGGETGCGLFFCIPHGGGLKCDRCYESKDPFDPKPDVDEWTQHKLTDPSWAAWRDESRGSPRKRRPERAP